MNLFRSSIPGIFAVVIFMGGTVILSVSSPLVPGSVAADIGIASRDATGSPPPQTPCRGIPVFKEDIIGFSVNKPPGWQIRYTTGVISILKDAQAREGVLIYPVRPKAGFSLAEFLSSYLNILKKSSTASSRIDYSEFSSGRERAQANVTGSMGGTTGAGCGHGSCRRTRLHLQAVLGPGRSLFLGAGVVQVPR